MKIAFNNILFVIPFVLISVIGNSQTDEIKIKFLGNCGLYLTDGKMNIYVDFPYKSGAYKYMEFESAELDSIKDHSIFIFTHKHADHYSGKNMRKTLKKKKGQKYGKWNIEQLEKLTNPSGDFSIEAIETEHSLSFKHYSYLITWHGKRLYFYGDTESTEILLTIKNLDWAFIPYWIATDLNEENANIDTKIIGVYHFYPNTIITNSSPERIKILDHQGETFLLTN